MDAILMGIILIALGAIVVFVTLLLMVAQGKAQGGGYAVVLVGPVPLVFKGPVRKVLVIASMALAAVLLLVLGLGPWSGP